MTMLWGIDLGGTKLEGAVLQSGSSPEPLCRVRIDTEAHHGYAHIIEQIAALVEKMSAAAGGARPVKLGLGTPGTFDPHLQAIKNSNTLCLNGKNLKADLESRLGMAVALANDANCFALAEATLGAAKGAGVVFGVIMGTGVGGGIVVNGKVWNGGQGIAGEWGHNVLDEQGPDWHHGKKGNVEAFLSGPALEKFYESQSGTHRPLKEIYARHLENADEHATATIRRLVHYFGKALAVVVNILDPDVIVLGGGASNIDLLYTEGRDEIAKHIFNPRLDTKIVKPLLGDSAGVFGAAMLTADTAAAADAIMDKET
ncbi:MAG: ROK family protein [Rhizobacter sp.]|nr:ROK family protein [Chlorobiales bacterium]